jgi:hypothetical protein
MTLSSIADALNKRDISETCSYGLEMDVDIQVNLADRES